MAKCLTMKKIDAGHLVKMSSSKDFGYIQITSKNAHSKCKLSISLEDLSFVLLGSLVQAQITFLHWSYLVYILLHTSKASLT